MKKGTIEVNRSLTQLKTGRLLEEPKTDNAFRALDIPPELVAELRRWIVQCPPNPDGYIFVDAVGHSTTRKQNNDMLKGACERAGVTALSMNNLRHTFASQHLIAGTPPLQVSAMMGHSDPGVTLKVYSKWAKTEKSEAQSRLADRIFNAEKAEEKAGNE